MLKRLWFCGWLVGLLLSLVACGLLAGQAVDEEPLLPLVQTLPPETAQVDLERLLTAVSEIPPRDLPDLTQRYKQLPVPATLTQPNDQMRQVRTFWYKEGGTDETRQVEARLVYQNSQLQLWIDQAERIDVGDLAEVAQVLNEQILPTNRDLFGADDETRLNILHVSELGGGTIGYFSAADSFSTAVNPFSNERKMAYISLELAPLASDAYYEVLAHELQHMMQWYTDGNESTWLNEGLSELAVTLNGYGTSQHIPSFVAQPDTPLTNFQYESADYGTAYLFATYFYDRVGLDGVRLLARDPANSLPSVQNTLDALGSDLTAEGLFADWVVTNYLDSHGRGQGIYQYGRDMFPDEILVSDLPDEPLTTAVNQYGADYYRLTGDTAVTLAFTGTTQTRLLETDPHSGAYLWSTVPSDSSATHLTRSFDLTAVSVPTTHLPIAPSTHAQFGEGIALRGYALDPAPEGLRLTLLWEGVAPLPEAYTLFVHLYPASAGTDVAPLAQLDTQPCWPTDRWRVGEYLLEQQTLPWPENLPPEAYHVALGWYAYPSFARLPLRAAGEAQAWPDNRLWLGEVRKPDE
ncbi:MAG: hypothetical protein KDD89_04100 [Anaerolineales bacterium]|nr:hypothetical protein [Anaerolineales bacterium]